MGSWSAHLLTDDWFDAFWNQNSSRFAQYCKIVSMQVTEDVDLSGVPDAAARRFISILLTKQSYLRKDIH